MRTAMSATAEGCGGQSSRTEGWERPVLKKLVKEKSLLIALFESFVPSVRSCWGPPRARSAYSNPAWSSPPAFPPNSQTQARLHRLFIDTCQSSNL